MSIKTTSLSTTAIVAFSLMIGCATVQKDWDAAKSVDTIAAYELFLQKHPNAEQANDANAKLEALRFEHAKASDSIFAYESYLKHHPDGSGAMEVQIRLRELRYADVRQRKTVAAFESFFARYSEGEDVDTLRAELPAIQALEKAWKTARHGNTVVLYNYYLEVYPNGDHAKEARARIQISKFNLAFGISAEFTEEQVSTYMKRLENETYSTVIKKPLEYYEIEGNACRGSTMTKRKVVVKPSPNQKTCSLQLEAGNLSITAIYISKTSTSSINRALFLDKWSPTMTHTGCDGPGLEIELPSDRRKEFRKFLDTFSIFYRDLHSMSWSTKGYVIPDLVWGSAQDGSPYYPYHPHRGRAFTIKHENRKIVFKIEGVEGMPVTKITTYKQALALKTYLKIIGYM